MLFKQLRLATQLATKWGLIYLGEFVTCNARALGRTEDGVSFLVNAVQLVDNASLVLTSPAEFG